MIVTRKSPIGLLSHFEMQGAIPESLNGLEPDLLADLYDCANCFGDLSPEEHCKRLVLRVPKKIAIIISSQPENFNMVIIGPEGKTYGGAEVIQLPNHNGIVWDKKVSVQDIEELIVCIDQAMADAEGFQPDGSRKDMCFVVGMPIVDQDEYFTRGSIVPVLPGADPEILRQKFLDPEKVVIQRTAFFGVVSLHHVRDSEEIAQREAIVIAYLADEWGITTVEQFKLLSIDEIIVVRGQIEQLLSVGS